MACPAHGARVLFDIRMRAWRCAACGHRVARDGEQPPRATRYMWPWMWPRELSGRRWARQAGQGRHSRAV